jgi:hypothetical protein
MSLLPVFFQKKESGWAAVKPFYEKLSEAVDSGELLSGQAFIDRMEHDPVTCDLTIYFIVDNTDAGPWGTKRYSHSILSADTFKVKTLGTN